MPIIRRIDRFRDEGVEGTVSARHCVTNHRNQPVELHLKRAVVVLPPRGSVELGEADLAEPQLQVLLACRLITTQEVALPATAAPVVTPAPAAPPAAAAPEAAAPGESAPASPKKPKTRGS